VQVNATQVVDRGNRPNVSQRVGLRTFFINDGVYIDPYEISSVQLFKRSDTLTPNSVTGSDGLVSATPLMAFAASASETLTGKAVHCTLTSPTGAPCNSANQGFDQGGYTPMTTASGIYKLGVGEYVVVLDQIEALSGWDYTTSTQVAASSLSAVNEYVDLWTVKLTSASKYQVITNQFSLYEDTFFAFTEPLLLTTSNKLMNKHVRYGEVIDLKVTTEATVQNESIPHSIQNIFKESVVSGATVTIKKVNQDPTLETTTVVPAVEMQVTKDNTLIYNWDTTATIATPVQSATFGSPTGTYSVQVTYTALNQTIISPLFYLTVS
jgi:hypothetical protein